MKAYKSIVVLTGAGISVESGLKTFRAADGLWENHRVEDVASPQGFVRDPELVHRFYNERRRQILNGNIEPNAAHLALSLLESEFNGNFLLITQNIDNLHERAGSQNILHMHGEILKKRCQACQKIDDIFQDIQCDDVCLHCGQKNYLRPHIVWFGEVPFEMERIFQSLETCDLFLSIGTSGHVYPAAGFAQVALSTGAHTVELNLDPSAVESNFKEKIYGRATEVVPRFVEQLCKS